MKKFMRRMVKINKDTGEILNNLKSKGSVTHVTSTGFIKQTFD